MRDLKDTASICATVRESETPVIVTKNGYAEMVLMRPDEWRELELARRRQEIYDAVDQAEEEYWRGEFVPAREALERLWKAHGLRDWHQAGGACGDCRDHAIPDAGAHQRRHRQNLQSLF